ncbi:hypothetical protein Hanom_Chr09g00760751 [Helianthus anomalus]
MPDSVGIVNSEDHQFNSLDLNIRAHEDSSSGINDMEQQVSVEERVPEKEALGLTEGRENHETELTIELGKELGVDLHLHKDLVEDLIIQEGIQAGKL